MKNLTAQAVYNADIYLRLSDDDGDKPESNSIKNQREFITEFLKSMPEIRIHAERKDDGFSGVDFFRPGIQEVLQDVRSGAVNCVVVKDLSRLGRNYIETGKVLQEFADHGVRFIAINDGYDTANAQGQASTILLPIKNLMNDSYSRDISVKIRSHLEVKKRKGQFVGAFAAYGYLKSPDDKNQLVVDDYAAEVVRDIFRWKLEGMSQQGIADRLNADGVLSPSEYKRSLGMKYISGFKSNPQAKWSAVAVGRILKNPLYIGVMVQGKTGRPNYKIKKLMEKPEDEWIRVPGAHEPIISEVDFRTVSGLLRRDTRIAVQKKTVYPFSGLTFFTMGGAASHDIEDGILSLDDPGFERKYLTLKQKEHTRFRIEHLSWWREELPSEEEYAEARKNLDAYGWAVDYILTHCAPTGIALQLSWHNVADHLTDFLQEVKDRAQYHYWLFGHYHDNRAIDTKHILLWEQIVQIL